MILEGTFSKTASIPQCSAMMWILQEEYAAVFMSTFMSSSAVIINATAYRQCVNMSVLWDNVFIMSLNLSIGVL